MVLVTNGDKNPLPSVVSVCQNVNIKQTNVIFGDVTRVLWGHEVIYDFIGDVEFAIRRGRFIR